jgi:biopolymer transport protein ExbD
MKRSKAQRRDVTIPVSSVGDIAFLLIIFFMVCSNFVKESSVKLEPPTARDLQEVDEAPVSVALNEEGQAFVNGQPVPDAEAVEWAVRALIKDTETAEGRTVMFKCDRATPREAYEPVIEALAEAGARITAVGDRASE